MNQRTTALASYKAKPGQDANLQKLLRAHGTLLRNQGLLSSRPENVLALGDGCYLEIIEWASEAHAGKAHENKAVQMHWGAMAEVADFVALNQAPGAILNAPFAKVSALGSESRSRVYSDNMLAAKDYPKMVNFYGEFLQLKAELESPEFSMLVDGESGQRLCITSSDSVSRLSVGVTTEDLGESEKKLIQLGGQVTKRWEFGPMKGFNSTDPEGNEILVWHESR